MELEFVLALVGMWSERLRDARHTQWTVTHKRTHRELQIPLEVSCETEMKRAFLERFPDDGFVGEETPPIESRNGRWWSVDPLCGTTNYVRGLPEYAISAALIEGGRTRLAVIGVPESRHIVHARLGKGAFDNNKALRVSGVATPNAAVVAIGQRLLTQAEYTRAKEVVFGQTLRARIVASANLELVYVAAGAVDFYCNVDQHLHDFVAGALLVDEAGGVSSDFSGRPIGDLGKPGSEKAASVLIGNPTMHRLFLRELLPDGPMRPGN